MERVKYITHKWMQILLLDFSYCGADDAQKTMDIAKRLIRAESESSLLILTDVTGARYNLETVEKLKDFANGNKPYVKASAVIGLDGMKKIIYNAVRIFSGRNIPAFDDVEKAKEWLIKQ
jgi:hypothetical protein